jgi:hypothetical protein
MPSRKMYVLAGVLALATTLRAVAPGTTSSQFVSPVVVATTMIHYAATGEAILDLMVLWRGSPGWFIKGAGRTSGGIGSRNVRGQQDIAFAQATYGDLTVTVKRDVRSGKVWVQNEEVVLGDANVILVDDVDTNLRIVGTRRIDPQLLEVALPGDRTQDFIRRAPELFMYLRCDTRLEGKPAELQQMMSTVCRLSQPEP